MKITLFFKDFTKRNERNFEILLSINSSIQRVKKSFIFIVLDNVVDMM